MKKYIVLINIFLRLWRRIRFDFQTLILVFSIHHVFHLKAERVKVIVYKHERAEEYHFWVCPKLPSILHIFTPFEKWERRTNIKKTFAFPILLYIFHPCEFSYIEKLKGHVPNYLSYTRPWEPFLFTTRAFV